MGELFVIFGFIALTALIVISGIRSVINRQLDHRERMAAAEKRGGELGENAYRQLEERVRVLERIATESRSDLAAQIEQLRDLDMIEDRSVSKETAA